jgi:predicted RNA-binding Zn ribbon-like protein
MTRPDLCLDFANTRYWRGQAAPTETLNAPADLATWTKAAKPPSPKDFGQAIALREAIYRLFDAQAQGKTTAPRDLEALNAALAQAPGRKMLKRSKGGYEWEVDARSAPALALLAPVLWSAGDLLAGPRLDRVRRCANPECGWLFLDDSRAGKRRWCSMSSCGNRAKAQRHYHKSKEDDS